MAAPKGHPRYGGRAKGSLNKTTQVRNERLLRSEQLTADHAIQNLSTIANTKPQRLTGADVIKANEVILRVRGALTEKHQDGRITVMIGFLTANQPADEPTTIDAAVMPARPQIASPDDSEG